MAAAAAVTEEVGLAAAVTPWQAAVTSAVAVASLAAAMVAMAAATVATVAATAATAADMDMATVADTVMAAGAVMAAGVMAVGGGAVGVLALDIGPDTTATGIPIIPTRIPTIIPTDMDNPIPTIRSLTFTRDRRSVSVWLWAAVGAISAVSCRILLDSERGRYGFAHFERPRSLRVNLLIKNLLQEIGFGR